MGAQAMLNVLDRMDLVFGIFYEPPSYKLDNHTVATMNSYEIPPEVATLIQQVWWWWIILNVSIYGSCNAYYITTLLSETGSEGS